MIADTSVDDMLHSVFFYIFIPDISVAFVLMWPILIRYGWVHVWVQELINRYTALAVFVGANFLWFPSNCDSQRLLIDIFCTNIRKDDLLFFVLFCLVCLCFMEEAGGGRGLKSIKEELCCSTMPMVLVIATLF